MILVLANSRDLPARRLVETWRAHDARLLTLADLSRAGWRHYLGEVGPEIAIACGELIPAASINGVITRIPWVTPEDLLHVVDGDRHYVAAEISAFLLAWLSQLTCPVINRPTTNGLMGAPHAAEGWMAIAARAGLRLPWTRRVFPAPPEPAWPPEAITVSVLGDRCFGNVDPALADQACRLAAAANVELLAVTFSHAAGEQGGGRTGRGKRRRGGRMILLWGMTGDEPLTAVTASLHRRNEPYALIDQRDILDTTVELTIGPTLGGTVTVRGESISLDDVGAVYLRQYDARQLPDVVEAGDAGAARGAAVETALWSWTEHTEAHVFNRPSAMASNGSKPYQAAIIQAVGLATPPTLITTDPAAAREFWHRHGTVIYKSVSSVRSIVSRLAPGDADRLDDVVTCPTQLQKYIAGHDVRVHVVGDDVFPARIESGADDYRYATRQGASVEMTACTLPADILARCIEVSARLRLPLAGIDLRVTPDGEWYCLEVNPSPAFTFYQRNTYQPISETFTQLLVDSARERSERGRP